MLSKYSNLGLQRNSESNILTHFTPQLIFILPLKHTLNVIAIYGNIWKVKKLLQSPRITLNEQFVQIK